ncbi:MAG: aminopeptidase [Acholeplasmatales bacterium]|jgi:aminopeptidase|nr:aminopeptidase [Acholeplasmataceae bacterium]MDY0115775.1 aminopeptidase [Acholeplasmatales bacterium]HHT39290.1 aminopeptidase [Acholeplasmataceae bacterium]
MQKEMLISKLAKLAVKVGVNVQKGQTVVVRSSLTAKELAREIVKEAYLSGARKVIVDWNDEYVSRSSFLYMDDETLQEVPDYVVDRSKYYVDHNASFISVISPLIGVNKDLDPKKMQLAMRASQEKLKFMREYTMGNEAPWTIVAAANPIWAKKVFPNLDEEDATNKLWEAIFNASRVYEKTDPLKEWEEHNENLNKLSTKLNNYQFEKLHFKNSLGTDLIVGLVLDHIWVGGGETARNGIYFNPNIPTEEVFTMPHKMMTEGKVVATKPLSYSGKVIEDFYLEFKDGAVVNFDAKKEKEALQSILEFDQNAKYIGEIALIGEDSPIAQTNLLFFNTLFDENASCHMALGRAYPMNIKDGIGAPIKSLEEKGYNNSMVHVDFMFGSPCLEITGIKKDSSKIKIFEKGNFII